MNKVLKAIFVVLAVVGCSGDALSKGWRKIVPLISTRTDVERLLGKPGKLNRYQFDDERVSILYSSGPCTGTDPGLRKQCKCLVPKDTVLAIYVEPVITLKFRSLNLDRRNFTRTPSVVDAKRVSYSNEAEGVDYTVDETDDEIMMVEYFPSARDCRKIVERNSRKKRNNWRGLSPMHSTRADVERVLGAPTQSCKYGCDYDTWTEGVFVRYSGELCPSDDPGALNIPPNTVISLKVYPFLKPRLKDLKLRMTEFTRTSDPELQGYSTYTNRTVGITYEVSDRNRVMSIEWFGSSLDIERLRCANGKPASSRYDSVHGQYALPSQEILELCPR